ncbi:MAG: dockerin type I domain-containing protein [Candidatus Poribacteria bacterium]|nr:dockerin type I domain-containing protein [Candidatus Poribacteria bacterium]MYK19103.1 hypothetical protein [Candidatus Poribacteria bacterium]
MKKMTVFLLVILLVSSVYLRGSSETVPQESAEPAVKVLKATQSFTVKRINRYPFPFWKKESWVKILEFPGPVVQTNAIWHARIGEGAVTDVTVNGNSVRISGNVRYSWLSSAVLEVRVDVAYLSVSQQITFDLNGDGSLNIQDLVFIASHFGRTGEQTADVNRDGVVNIQDLVLVAGVIR